MVHKAFILRLKQIFGMILFITNISSPFRKYHETKRPRNNCFVAFLRL